MFLKKHAIKTGDTSRERERERESVGAFEKMPPAISCPNLEEDGLNRGAIPSALLLHHGVQDGPGGDALVSQALRAAHQPHEHVRHGVLGLQRQDTYQL